MSCTDNIVVDIGAEKREKLIFKYTNCHDVHLWEFMHVDAWTLVNISF